MLPIHKLKITKEKQKDGSLAIIAKIRHADMVMMSPEDQRIDGLEKHIEDSLRRKLWWSVYRELQTPLYELMILAERAAKSNPCAYPEAARVEELTKELNDLLDWRKQMAAAERENKIGA